MISCLWVLFAFCLAAEIFMFVGGCEVFKEYDKRFTELDNKVNENADSIRVLQKSCEEVKTNIENICNSFNAMLEHNNDLCLDMDEYDKQLEQMGEALEKHISDRVVWHELEELKKEIDELKPIVARWLEPIDHYSEEPDEDIIKELCHTIDDTDYDEEDVYHE